MLEITEPQADVKRCLVWGLENQGRFPAEVSQRVQYVCVCKGGMVYLMEGQLIPSGRTVELLVEMFGTLVSEETLDSARLSPHNLLNCWEHNQAVVLSCIHDFAALFEIIRFRMLDP